MLADKIREFAYREYIEPARAEGRRTVTIRAGDVHTAMGLSARFAAVCAALGTNLFQDTYHIRCISKTGPLNGANCFFTFEV